MPCLDRGGAVSTQPMSQPAARESLAGWLSRKLAADGCRDVRIQELSAPDAGYSGKTIFVTVSATAADGGECLRELVFRVQVADQQLFVAPDALRQARVMSGLAGQPGVPVPGIRFTEPDPQVLGAPFYVMDRVRGRVPGDVPSWHRKGWTVDLSPGERTRLHDNGLAALVALHQVDWRAGLGFLDPPGAGAALDRYLAQLGRWYEWCAPSRRFGPDVLAAGLRYVLDHRPGDPGEGIVWGD